nr:Acyl-coenzyme A oxidase [Ipomoea batatas]
MLSSPARLLPTAPRRLRALPAPSTNDRSRLRGATNAADSNAAFHRVPRPPLTRDPADFVVGSRSRSTIWVFGRPPSTAVLKFPRSASLTSGVPGGIGYKSAIPIVVYACLITEGFIVQLRSLEDNKPLPGITVLEILE